MDSLKALKMIAGISVLGILFSGYLSYSELFSGKCLLGSCPFVASIPACVYGLVMYVIVLAIALLGLGNKKKKGKKRRKGR